MKQLRFGIAAACLIAMMLGVSACDSSGSTVVPWHNYPHIALTTTNKPWLVILCKVNDNNTEPAGVLEQARRFLTVGGMGQGNIADYYSDVSYGAISLVGTRVIGWYTAPFSTADLGSGGRLSGPNKRYERVKECANAVPDADADFGGYWGIIMITNIVNDGGACAIGQLPMEIHNQTYNEGCVVFDPDSLYTAFAAHEIGHGYGLVHSFDSTKCEYCDQWDIMSALNTYRFAGANFLPSTETQQYLSSHGGDYYDGPGLNAPNLLQLGWIPSTRIATYHIGSPNTTITLTALSHPISADPLTVEIVSTDDPNDIYTVEYRQKDGWDAGIPANAVLIHEYQIGQNPWSFLQRNNAPISGEWLPGMTWLDPVPSVSVEVKSIDASAGTATVTIGPPQLFSSKPNISIAAPANGSTFAVGQQFQLVATATNYAGQTLPDSEVTWQVNSTTLGTGKILTTSLPAPGTYTIIATANDSGESASASVTVNIVQEPTATPPPKPTVQILSPTAGKSFLISPNGSFTLTLASSASAGVIAYKWSDSLGLFTDANANDTLTVNVPQSKVGCGGATDTITLTVTDNHNQTASAQVMITIAVECIQ
jgi:hypothetical protein